LGRSAAAANNLAPEQTVGPGGEQGGSAANSRRDGKSLHRAIARTGSALHAQIEVPYLQPVDRERKNTVRADFGTQAAADASLSVDL